MLYAVFTNDILGARFRVRGSEGKWGMGSKGSKGTAEEVGELPGGEGP